jgi:hypothetical protein
MCPSCFFSSQTSPLRRLRSDLHRSSHVSYALDYQELTGQRADYVEIYELVDQRRKPRSVDDDFIDPVKHQVRRIEVPPYSQASEVE